MEPIESRTLWTSLDKVVTVEAVMYADYGYPNWPEFEDPEQEKDFRDRYARGDFTYVGLEATVTVNGIPIGKDSIWGTEHGTVGEGVEANAWDFTPAQYLEPSTVIMPSVLVGVITEALATTAHWLTSVNAAIEIRNVVKVAQLWADPNNPNLFD